MSTKTENMFIERIKEVYDMSVGSEDYGDTTEFYDECGCCLMTCTEKSENVLEFRFMDGEQFDYHKN